MTRSSALLLTWLVLALVVGASGLLDLPPRPVLQLILFGLAGMLLALYFAAPATRAALDAFDNRALVAFHLTRFVGFYFLYLYERGELPWAFAVPGGWGDIIVATLAIPVMLIANRADVRSRTLLAAWNAIGLIDILMVVAAAARAGLADAASMRPLTHLPLALLPTFVVPIIIATHIILFARLARART